MRYYISVMASVVLFSAFTFVRISHKVVPAQETKDYLSQDIPMCGSVNKGEYIPNKTKGPFPLLGGWDFHLPISTKSDSAQLYFDQGLVLYYSFHNQEAKASFQKAQTFDASCSMLYWGEAMCHGEYVWNKSLSEPVIADSLIEIASRYLNKASPFEHAIIKADAILLKKNPLSNVADSNKLKEYESAMEKVYKDFPENADAAGAFIAAVDWNNKRSHDERKRLYISMLEKFPDHPYLNHLFIHFIESTEPQIALSSAESLLKKTPGISHMVHMTSHIYVQTGNYEEGVMVNKKARELYSDYMKIYPALTEGTGRYIYMGHPLGMELSNAVNLPSYEKAEGVVDAQNRMINSINESRLKKGLKKLNPKSLGTQMATAYFEWVKMRYGKWDEILKENPIPDSIKLRSYMQHFAKGMALARTDRYAESEYHLAFMQQLIHDSFFKVKPSADTLSTYLRIAIPMLKAILAEEQKHYIDAEKFYLEAIAFEDLLQFDDPKPWFIAIRPFLGNSLLKSGNYSKAEEIFKADLKIHPDNYWGLRGLMLALEKQNKKEESDLIQDKMKSSFSYSGREPNGAIY
ncbi:hypothetical protein NF867_15795 [Solitalea sp. MAHUQ-68]|uniref:Tetratricopeptide repeat protein n=1 Tax=Solitalea agri TaxID=2953739 RepID=A0A9X2JEV2_9SPHI|nr:hypothetical protein [Solitalea agri]MCO4294325.1 hypothetical protein [Solitalea agri]